MIRNENEYREAVARIAEEEKRLEASAAELRAKKSLSEEEIDRALAPFRSFHAQLVEEVESYERLKRGDIQELQNLRGLGHLLISLRIARGLTQRQLAERLGVHETQVSRDERNEYFRVTVDRAAKILDTLGAEIRMEVNLPSSEPAASPAERPA